MQAFASLAGCAESTNENYNADCIGGSINLQFNTNNGHSGQAIKSELPAYALQLFLKTLARDASGGKNLRDHEKLAYPFPCVREVHAKGRST